MTTGLARLVSRLLIGVAALGAAACGKFPEPATVEPRLSAWVAERYGGQLAEARIEKIFCYSDRLEKPVAVRQREGHHIYFPYPRGRGLTFFSVEIAAGGPVVRYDGLTEESFAEVTANLAAVIEEAIARARTANQARELERRSG